MPASWINVAEFLGGDPEDPANYTMVSALEFTADNYEAFHVLNRLDGSTEYVDNAIDLTDRNDVTFGNSNPEFASKFVDLGDADLDGVDEIAFGIQGVRDSLYTFTEVAADSFIVDSVVPFENRIFMRVLSGSGLKVSIDEERIVMPNDYKLHANYPNPFNPTTTIAFTLPLDKAVSVRVFDVTGRLVRTLVDNQLYNAGTYEGVWDGTSDAGNTVASGSYLYTLEYGNFRQSKTMVMIK
jgi:hypothetical protein